LKRRKEFFDFALGQLRVRSNRVLHWRLKRTVGSSYETGPIEVGWPVGYPRGPFTYNEFAKAAQQYFRSQVGAQGSGIRIEGGAANIRMRNNRFVATKVVEFEAREGEDGW
jgi:hypothetical protein